MKIYPNNKTIIVKPYVHDKKEEKEKKTTGFADFAFSSENKAKKWEQYKPYVVVDMSDEYKKEVSLKVGDCILAEAAAVSVVTMPDAEVVYFIASGAAYVPLVFES